MLWYQNNIAKNVYPSHPPPTSKYDVTSYDEEAQKLRVFFVVVRWPIHVVEINANTLLIRYAKYGGKHKQQDIHGRHCVSADREGRHCKGQAARDEGKSKAAWLRHFCQGVDSVGCRPTVRHRHRQSFFRRRLATAQVPGQCRTCPGSCCRLVLGYTKIRWMEGADV